MVDFAAPGVLAPAGSVVGAIFGWLAARFTAKTNAKTTMAVSEQQIAQAIQADLSRRYEVLLNGYDKRIKELTEEVEALRKRVEYCEARWKAHGEP
jgi:hypothetical protein